jgi:protein TonB
MLLSVALALAMQIGNPNGSRTTPSQGEFERQLRDSQTDQRDKLPPSPVFLKTPDGSDMIANYPPDAMAKKLAGSATVRCKIDKSGAFTGCKVVSETPAKNGFGDAALKLSKVFLLSPKAADGTNIVGESLTIPMQFNPG